MRKIINIIEKLKKNKKFYEIILEKFERQSHHDN